MKDNKKTLKKLVSAYMQKRYANIIEYLFSNTPNAETNIQFLLDNEPDFLIEIANLKEQQEIKQAKLKFNTINMQEDELTKYLLNIQNDILLIADAINRENNKETTNETALKIKMGHISNLTLKLETLQKMYDILANLIEEKRPRGRPKKDEQKEICENVQNE